jgi:LmbE family N-acetylglucosaminyl deacetylase
MMRKRSLALLAILLSFSCVFFAPSTAKAESSTPQVGVDLMIICAHPGDEYLFLSGALSLYAGEQGRSAVVVYLSQSDEATQTAAKAALARYGDQVQAVFGAFSANYADSKDLQLRYWDSRAVITYLVGVIREYKPAIVLTHQPLGEYGNGAHIVTSDSVFMAVRYARKQTAIKRVPLCTVPGRCSACSSINMERTW